MKKPHPSSPNRRFLRPIPADRALLFEAPDAFLPRTNTMLGIPSLGGRAVKWYHDEIKPWAALVHPNISTVYELVDDHPTGVFEIRQQFAGIRLQKYLDEGGRLGPREVRHLIEGVAAGLEHAHEHGVVHGLLNPDLIELGSQGTVLLHRLSPAAINAWAGHKAATARLLFYRSPEQVQGEKPTARSDVFALAILAYQLVVGRLPFSALDPSALDAEILKADPPLAPLRPGFALTVPEALRHGLAAQPGRRYKTPTELLRALFVESPIRRRDLSRARDQYLAGMLWMRLPRPQPALECWLETRWLCPGIARLESNIGVALATLGQLAEAEQHFAAAAELAPEDDMIRMHLGWARWKQGKGEQPIDHLFADPDEDLDVPFDREFEPRLLEVEEAELFRRVGSVWPRNEK